MPIFYPWEWRTYMVLWTRVRICCPGAIPSTGSGNWTGKWSNRFGAYTAERQWICSRPTTMLSVLCFFPERSERASGDRCAGARMASHSPLCVPTDNVDIPNTLKSEGGGTTIDTIAPRWPGKYWLAKIIHMLYEDPWSLPLRRDLLSQAEGEIFHPHPERLALWAWPVSGSI